MNDLKLDLSTRDLIINTAGDLELINTEQGVARQTLEINLLTYKGEWFLDLNVGVPYFQTILKRGTAKSLVDAIFRQNILASYNISSIEEYVSEVSDGTYTVLRLRATTSEGDIVSITNQRLI